MDKAKSSSDFIKKSPIQNSKLHEEIQQLHQELEKLKTQIKNFKSSKQE